MKQIITLIIVCAALSGCHTTKTIPQIVEHATHDTLYINRLQFDSIYINDSYLMDFRRDKRWDNLTIQDSGLPQPSPLTPHLMMVDTMYIRDTQLEYKYKYLHDTTYIHRVDTIPIVHTIDVIKPEPYVPVAYKYLTIIGIIALLLAGYRIYRKISLTLHR